MEKIIWDLKENLFCGKILFEGYCSFGPFFWGNIFKKNFAMEIKFKKKMSLKFVFLF